MPHQRVAQDAATISGRAGSKAQIGFLMDEEEPLVEWSERTKQIGPDHHAAAVYDVHADDGTRVVLAFDLKSLKKLDAWTRIEADPIGHDDAGFVHEVDHGTCNAKRIVHSERAQQRLHDERRDNRVVVQNENEVGA